MPATTDGPGERLGIGSGARAAGARRHLGGIPLFLVAALSNAPRLMIVSSQLAYIPYILFQGSLCIFTNIALNQRDSANTFISLYSCHLTQLIKLMVVSTWVHDRKKMRTIEQRELAGLLS